MWGNKKDRNTKFQSFLLSQQSNILTLFLFSQIGQSHKESTCNRCTDVTGHLKHLPAKCVGLHYSAAQQLTVALLCCRYCDDSHVWYQKHTFEVCRRVRRVSFSRSKWTAEEATFSLQQQEVTSSVREQNLISCWTLLTLRSLQSFWSEALLRLHRLTSLLRDDECQHFVQVSLIRFSLMMASLDLNQKRVTSSSSVRTF